MEKESGTISTPPAGSGAAGPVAPGLGGGVMSPSLADLAARLGGSGSGGPGAAAVGVQEKRPLTELTVRVLARVGQIPFKALAVFTGGPSSVAAEDAQLVGECTVDVVRLSAAAPDPATEAWGRLALVLGGLLGEGYLARLEKRLAEKRKAEGAPNA